MIEQIKEQLKKISDIAKEHGYITLQEAHTVACEIKGIKYSYDLAKGCTVLNIADRELAKILRVYEIIDSYYKHGKIKIEDLEE